MTVIHARRCSLHKNGETRDEISPSNGIAAIKMAGEPGAHQPVVLPPNEDNFGDRTVPLVFELYFSKRQLEEHAQKLHSSSCVAAPRRSPGNARFRRPVSDGNLDGLIYLWET